MNNNSILNVFTYRIPPFCWDIVSYIVAITAIFYHTTPYLIFYTTLIILYGLLNLFFDVNTVSFDFSNEKMPNYNEFGNNKYFITNPLYALQDINQSQNGVGQSEINMIDNSKLKLTISIYVGDNKMLKTLLYIIYFFGITKKNFTSVDKNNFKENVLHFV